MSCIARLVETEVLSATDLNVQAVTEGESSRS